MSSPSPAEVERAARQAGFAVLSQHTAERELNLWSILQSDLKPL